MRAHHQHTMILILLSLATSLATDALLASDYDSDSSELAHCYDNVPESTDECTTISYDNGCIYALNVDCMLARRCLEMVADLGDDCMRAQTYDAGTRICSVLRDLECIKARRDQQVDSLLDRITLVFKWFE